MVWVKAIGKTSLIDEVTDWWLPVKSQGIALYQLPNYCMTVEGESFAYTKIKENQRPKRKL